MKKLFLIRHAKSSWEDSNQNDFERPLNKKGFSDALLMAKKFKEKNIVPNKIISSPASRAVLTAGIFAEEFNFDKDRIETDERIYEAGMRELMNVVRDIQDTNTVLLFGHNPGLTSFTNLLSNKFIPDMPTCAIVGIEFELNSWREVERGNGKLFLFDYPKNHNK